MIYILITRIEVMIRFNYRKVNLYLRLIDY
jgi:hypothetical protein